MKAIDALALAGTNIVCLRTKGQNWKIWMQIIRMRD